MAVARQVIPDHFRFIPRGPCARHTAPGMEQTHMPSQSLSEMISRGREYWRLVARHKWETLVSTLALTTLFTAIIAKLPNIYEAVTTILVDPQQVPEKYVSPAVVSDPYARLNTITQQVLSRTRLAEIIEKFDLYKELRGSKSAEELIEDMRRDITIQVKQGSGPELSTFTITYQGKQPVLVAQVANELATSFIQWNISSREQRVTGTKDFVFSELQVAKQNLEQQEDRLRQFKMEHLGETPDQLPNNFQALAGLRSALQANSDAMNRLDEQRMLQARLAEVVPPNAVANVELTERQRLEFEKRQLEANIQHLRERYADRYPDVVKAARRLEEVNARLASLPPETTEQKSQFMATVSSGDVSADHADREFKRLQAEQAQIQSQIVAYQAKIDITPVREQQLLQLTRNYDTSKQHYQVLLDKSFNISMAVDLEQKQKAERFTVLDEAQVPEKPVRPRRKLFAFLSGWIALGLSVGFVTIKETLSPALKTEMEVKSMLPIGVPIVVLIPHVPAPGDSYRNRRRAIVASLICVVLCVVLTGVLWKVHSVSRGESIPVKLSGYLRKGEFAWLMIPHLQTIPKRNEL